eukprot:m.1681400 g.1681400  ORF g.1681400 m.1681400 type:complete len:68 (-) comp227204_c0_seq1:90-293(-)
MAIPVGNTVGQLRDVFCISATSIKKRIDAANIIQAMICAFFNVCAKEYDISSGHVWERYLRERTICM